MSSAWPLAAAGLLLAGACALAGESADLQKQIDELKARLDALEKQRTTPAVPPVEPKKSLWTDNLKLSGDLRLRGEYTQVPGRNPPVADRERLSFRARVELDAKVSDELEVRFRIGTAMSSHAEDGGDAASNDQDMTNDSSKKPLWLDLAMFDYHPRAIEGLHLLGGKIEQPFFTPGGSDLIWSRDLTLEGGAVRYGPKLGDFEPMAVAGAFWIRERSDLATDTADSGLVGGQLGLEYNLSEKVSFLAGCGYFQYLHTTGFPVFDHDGTTTNSVSAHNEYLYDYHLFETFLEIGFPCPLTGRPVTIFGDYVLNTVINDDDKEGGWLGGVRLGKLEKPWDWSLYVDYRHIEKDAVVAAFNGTDALGGGTNGKGYKFGAELQLMKNVWTGAYYYADKQHVASEDLIDRNAPYRRFQLDINFKF
jgi:hypothetical protein